MRSDVAEIIDSLLTSDKINADEKEAIRMSINEDVWIMGEWVKVKTVDELKKWLVSKSGDTQINSLELRTLKNVKTGVFMIQNRNPEDYEDD